MADNPQYKTTVREAVGRALHAVADAGSAQPLAPWEKQYPSVRSRYLRDADLLLSALEAAGVKVEAANAG